MHTVVSETEMSLTANFLPSVVGVRTAARRQRRRVVTARRRGVAAAPSMSILGPLMSAWRPRRAAHCGAKLAPADGRAAPTYAISDQIVMAGRAIARESISHSSAALLRVGPAGAIAPPAIPPCAAQTVCRGGWGRGSARALAVPVPGRCCSVEGGRRGVAIRPRRCTVA